MSGPLLDVAGLSVDFATYGRQARVLDGVSLQVRAGQHAALVGETGCGKSVTLRAIMGILKSPPASIAAGSIGFDGTDLLTMPERQRDALKGTAMSMVFQDPMTALNPVFTIGDQLATIIKYADRRMGVRRDKQGRKQRVIEVLEQVRMPDPERIFGAYPIMLSGGMRQRILIAMALLNEPRLLIADEPGTALDVTTQAEILALLNDLVAARSLALLMITHNLGVVREMADYVYVMYAGTIVEHGPTDSLFERPSHPYTQALIECVPKLSGTSTFKGIDGTIPDYVDPPVGCRFRPRCPHRHDACFERPPNVTVGANHGAACWLRQPAGEVA
ncbi:MAG: ABC transporter ATP-binding protein [Pseudomonadota bacterium]